MTFIQDQILFFLSIALVLFLPGYFLLLAIFGKKYFSIIENFVISFGLSIVSINFLIIFLGKLNIFFSRWSILTSIIFFSLIFYGIYRMRNFKNATEKNKLFSFSKNKTILIILLLFLTVFIKTSYLTNSIFPTATDLGHHMYWSKLISETGQLPEYEKMEIIKEDSVYQITNPQSIDDFIIGEHLFFSAINLLSGVGFVSYFPSLVLLLVNIMSILAIFILTLRFFEGQNNKFAQNIGLFLLLFLGPLYAISSSQAKFVSGGAIGNLLGNLLIPLSLYFYFRALKEKSSWLLATAVFLTFGLFYTHHLSSFIFIFIFAFTVLFFVIFNLKNIVNKYMRSWIKLVLSPPVIASLIIATCFFLFVYTPVYLQENSVDTAVGGPSKSTRTGLTPTQLKLNIGEIRLALGLFGVLLIIAFRFISTKIKFNKYASAFALGWSVSLLIMTLKPHWLYLDLPSGRIANYIPFPISIVAAFAISWIVSYAKNEQKNKYFVPPKALFAVFVLIIISLFANGLYDNSQSLNAKSNAQEAKQTFHASFYLENNLFKDDIILKDHNSMTADTWMKLFFMRDYNFPFSRSYFKRYEDPTKPREMCTLWMISEPGSENGQKCYRETDVNLLVVNPKIDGIQFEKQNNFWKIYSGDEVAIYQKEKQYE